MLPKAEAEITGFSLCSLTNPALYVQLGIEEEMKSSIGDVADFERLSKAFCKIESEIMQ